jgi:hypothetical protein
MLHGAGNIPVLQEYFPPRGTGGAAPGPRLAGIETNLP